MAIISKLYILIILYAGWTTYTKFEEHNLNLEGLNGRIPEIQNKISKAKKEKKQLEVYFQDIEEAKRRIGKVAEEVEKIQQQFPSDISDTDNLALISQIAESLNIKNVQLAPGEEQNKGFYFAKNYNVKGTGTFLQFVIFLEKIAEAPRLLNIKSINLSQKDMKQKGRFQLIEADMRVEVYRYNKGHKEETGIEAIEQQFKEDKPVRKRNKG